MALQKKDSLLIGAAAFVGAVAILHAVLGLPTQKDGFEYFVDSFRSK